jgi:alpha-tubulin suppressor-like RCC1 family protein
MMYIYFFACLTFETNFAIDNDGDGYTEYDGDCNDYARDIGLSECIDDDGDGQNEYEGDCDDTDPYVFQGNAEKEGNEEGCYRDKDRDGYGEKLDVTEEVESEGSVGGNITSGQDCDDGSALIHPNANEYCDELDNNCDELVDNDPITGTTYYLDSDGDDFGSSESIISCSQQEGYSIFSTDCDDSNSTIHPNAKELCDGENIDENCNGFVNDEDENINIESQSKYYLDEDGDGYGNPYKSTFSCLLPEGYVENDEDCIDDAEYQIGEVVIYGNEINPSRDEICDDLDIDENCNGYSDDNDSLLNTTSTTTFYLDYDNDNYGADNQVIQACSRLAGTIEEGGDCDDTNPSIHPNALEYCDGENIDENCNGFSDNDDIFADYAVADGSRVWFFADEDGDGYGAENGDSQRLCDSIEGWSLIQQDCNDENDTINPDVPEICDDDNVDENCNNLSDDEDENVQNTTVYYVDADSDGFGNENLPVQRCDSSIEFTPHYGSCVSESEDPLAWLDCNQANAYFDCDDGDPEVNYKSDEICDGIDNDCDGEIDDADTSVFSQSGTTFYVDNDGDGYGDTDNTEKRCAITQGYTSQPLDCDDENATVYPEAIEICDGLFNNCTLRGSLSLPPEEEQDVDGDGYVICSIQNWQGDEIIGGEDCNDADNSVYPNAPELCDSIFNDCNHLDWGIDIIPVSESDSDGDNYVSCDYRESVWKGNNILGGLDCDDDDTNVISSELDRDCDTILDTMDCAPENSSQPSIDADCDDIVTDEDCDDSNPLAGGLPSIYDENCDGKLDDSVSVGSYHSCVIDSYRNLSCFGDNTYGQTEVPEGLFLQVAAGDNHTCAVDNIQEIQCWGDNSSQQSIPPGGTYIQVSSGADFSCALDIDGYATCWGNIVSGRGNVPSVPLQDISAGEDHICGLDLSGEVLCWGSGTLSQTTAPAGIFNQISSGDKFTCGIGDDRRLQCWGNFVSFINSFVENVSAGANHICVVDVLQNVDCVGELDFERDEKYLEVSSGDLHSCGMDENLNIWCWGANHYGQSRTDFDDDGTSYLLDCNDNDAQEYSLFEDDDCDGVLRIDDCDDLDPNLGDISIDADCDGILTGDDCDDNLSDDDDCDGVFVEEDCNDNDDTIGSFFTDVDCDGVVTEEDCDDTEASLGNSISDNDCDGIVFGEDCDDTDIGLGASVYDDDCDGLINDVDLDADGDGDCDNSASSIEQDQDCDGVVTEEDCDDNDVLLGSIENDVDCDGILTGDDCDDDLSGDNDCDGVVTEEDCDDSNALVSSLEHDLDCDGVLTDEDCDDSNPELGLQSMDNDCDGITTVVDCNDSVFDMENSCLLPTKISFSLRGVWDGANQMLYPVTLFGSLAGEHDAVQEDVIVDVLLVDDEYEDATTDEERQEHSCHVEADYIPQVGTFDLELEDATTMLEYWGTFDGVLHYSLSSISEGCSKIDASVFTTGQPEFLQDFRFGIAFAPLTTILEEVASELYGQYWSYHQDFHLAQYIFVERMDTEGSYSFLGEPMSYGVLYETNSNRHLILDIDDYSPNRISTQNSPHFGYVRGETTVFIPLQEILTTQ